ncbi:MAG TPA: hypothetical protein VKB51_18850 [bacterium]|nr:hypothetical protein [bacterium]
MVTPSGVAGVQFMDEASAINRQVCVLKAQGVRAIVAVIHQGTLQIPFEGATPDISTSPQGAQLPWTLLADETAPALVRMRIGVWGPSAPALKFLWSSGDPTA